MTRHHLRRGRRDPHTLAQINSSSTSATSRDVEQWASKVLSFSSQYNTGGYSAAKILGKPDVFPKYGDKKGTWAQKHLNANQFIQIEFPESIYIDKVEILETYHAGGVKKISAKKPGGTWFTLWETSSVSVMKHSVVFSPKLKAVDFVSKTLKIDVDCSKSKSWVEIDAVKMIGRKSKSIKPHKCKSNVEQWVSKVRSFSSEHDAHKWTAKSVVGPPNVYPAYADKAGSWAQKTKDANQFIEVEFEHKMYIKKIEIYENFHAGGVKRVLAARPSGKWYTVWQTNAVSDIKSARIFTPTFKPPTFATNVLKVEVDCTKSKSWVEIDAIKITGKRV